MRTISGTNLAALSAAQVARAYLLRLDFPSEVIGLHGGVGEYTFGGVTYRGMGRFTGGISTVSEGSDAKPRGMTFELTGLDLELLSKVQGEVCAGRDADLFMLLFNAVTFEPLTTPYTVWSGLMDTLSYRIDVGAFDLQLACESRLVKLGRRNTRRRTNADQQARFPGDLFFQYTDQLRYHKVQIGGQDVPIVSPGRRPAPPVPGGHANIP